MWLKSSSKMPVRLTTWSLIGLKFKLAGLKTCNVIITMVKTDHFLNYTLLSDDQTCKTFYIFKIV